MPLLPVDRSANDTRGRKKLSGQRLSGGDAPVINPGVARAKDLSVPQGAFDSGLSQVTQEAAPFVADTASRLQTAEIKQQSRTDTIARASSINQHTETVNAELSRLNSEEDLSDPKVMAKYGAFLSQQEKQMLESHEGSPDSMATLTVRLGDVSSGAVGRGSALSAKIGSDKAKQLFEGQLTPLGEAVSADPSMKNIDTQLTNLNTSVADVAGAFDPSEEALLLKTGREHIARSAMNSLINGGNLERAKTLLSDPTIANGLPPAARREYINKLNVANKAKNKFRDEMRQKEEFLGRPFTTQEREQLLDIDPTTNKLTQFDKEVKNLTDRGFNSDFAHDIAGGNVKIVGPDNTGQFFSINAVTKKKTLLTEDMAAVGTKSLEGQEGQEGEKTTPAPEATPAPEQAPVPEKTSLDEAIEVGTGPFAQVQAGLANVIGPFTEGALFQETTDARQQVKTFAQVAKTALVNNPKFPVAEQKIVQGLLPNVETFFQDPDTARSDMKVLRSSLEGMQEAKLKELTNAKGITSKRRGELADQISSVNEILSMMETPEEAPLPEGIEEGSRLVGKSKGGFDVYQTSDGRQFEVTPDEEAAPTEKAEPPKKKVTDTRVKNPTDDMGFGLRHQPGQGDKGIGFIEGEHFDKNDDRMTEVTIGVMMDGKEVDIPLINGLTTRADMKIIASGKKDPVIDAKAELFALARMAEDKSIYLEKGEKQIPLEFKLTKLKPAKEKEFQSWIRKQPWFDEFKKDRGEEPDLDTKDFDYRGAWKDGETPTRSKVDNKLHWGSKFKSTSHPTKWKDMFMKASGGIDPDDVGVKNIIEGLDYLKNGKKTRNQETPESQDLERIVQLFDELEADPSDKKKKKQVVKLLTALEKKLGIKVDEDFIKNARK